MSLSKFNVHIIKGWHTNAIVVSYDISHYTTINLQVRMLAVERKTPQYLQTCRKKWLWSSRKK